MQRYAVLADIDAPDFRRIGLAVERSDGVHLYALDDYGVRDQFDQPYTVREPDGGEVVYQPGTPEYFDYVLLTISRTFLVADVREVEQLDSIAISQIFLQEVQPALVAMEYEIEPLIGIGAAAGVTAAFAAPREPQGMSTHSRRRRRIPTAA